MNGIKYAVFIAFFSLFVLTGCEAEKKHKALSFFFDGVPPLKAKTTEVNTGEPTLNEQKIVVREYVHAPYRDNSCSLCHDQGRGKLVNSTPDLCNNCHSVAGRHIPFADCLSCHFPHKSTQRFLLKAESGALCTECHGKAHKKMPIDKNQNCTECHKIHVDKKIKKSK